VFDRSVVQGPVQIVAAHHTQWPDIGQAGKFDALAADRHHHT
jgi:hypothetical protein